MNFKSFYLLEAKQVGTLYHSTSLERLLSILSENTIKGLNTKRFIKVSGKEEVKKILGISFSRDKNSRLDLKDTKLESTIVADGDKISNRHKISQFDEFSTYSNDSFSSRRMEAEEFVHGDIPNIKSYIKEIYLDKDLISKHYNKSLKDFIVDKYKIESTEDFISDVSNYIKSKYNIKVSLK